MKVVLVVLLLSSDGFLKFLFLVWILGAIFNLSRSRNEKAFAFDTDNT